MSDEDVRAAATTRAHAPAASRGNAAEVELRVANATFVGASRGGTNVTGTPADARGRAADGGSAREPPVPGATRLGVLSAPAHDGGARVLPMAGPTRCSALIALAFAVCGCSSPAAVSGDGVATDATDASSAGGVGGPASDTRRTTPAGGAGGAHSATATAGASGHAAGTVAAADGGTQGLHAAGTVAAADGGAPGVTAGGARAQAAGRTGAAAADGGASGALPPAFHASYFLGADVSDQEPQAPATRANLLETLAAHGFNAIRLRTFVDPRAADGYDRANGSCDLATTIDFAKQIKAAGFGLLLDFHYSDNWADPGKQCVPIAWQKHTTIDALAGALHDYTRDAIAQLVAAGARPDLVQIGNEITPGLLLHRCDASGQPTGDNPITGSTKDWSKLGALLAAGAAGVKEIDATIELALHIDRCGDKPSERAGTALDASASWVENARKYVSFDALGESCYQRYQGDPASTETTQAGWTRTLSGLAQRFPDLRLFAAEYGPMQREVNDVLFGLPDQRGIGTFNWEPTTQGDWNTGHDLLRRSGDTYAAAADLTLYDAMARDYAGRL